MKSKRLWGALAIAALLTPVAAMAKTADPGFDVETATRAYLDLLQGPARAKSDAYFEGGYWLPLWSALISVVVYLVLLASGWSARMRDWAERTTKRRWLVPALFALPFAVVTTVATLPWSIYTGFVREGQYGLMNQGFGEWLIDQAKFLGIGIVLNAILFLVLFAVIRRFPRRWWLIGVAVFGAFTAFGALIAPVFIAPIFNNYTELPAGPLRDRIVGIAAANKIPAQHIYVSDASRQTKRISANVSGLGPTVRITLNDNLLKRTSSDEIVAVLGHEMGHYVLHHIWNLLFGFMILYVIVWYAMARLSPAIIARNPKWMVRDISDPAVIPLLLAIGSIGILILTPLQNSLIRHNESEADVFGLNAAREPDGFAMTAIRLSEYRKLEPGPLEEMVFFDHPSGETRVRMSMQWKKDHVPGATMVKPEPIADAK